MATDTTEQIVRESPEIEAYKLNLMRAAGNLQPPTLPQYQVAGFTPQQTAAMQAGQQGIGAYSPYLQAGQNALTAGTATTGEAANILRGADTRGQFAAAQQAMNNAAVPASQIGQLANVAGSGLGYLSAGSADIDYAQQMAAQNQNANLQPSQNMMMNAAQQAQQAAYQPGFGQGQSAVQSGIGALQGAAQRYDPSSAQAYMNPYQQQVIDESMRQIDRQGAIQQANLQGQATRAGAFGGSREGVQRAELGRNLAETKNAAIIGALQQGYGTAQQQSQQAFEQQQQRQLAQGQGLAQTGATAGNLAAQQAGLQQAGAQYAGSVGQNLGAQELQRAGLGQSAASLYGQLGSQQAGLAGQQAGIAGQQAGILGQQSQLQQQLGQGIGSLAGQQFGIGSQMSQGLGALGGQMGQMGMQQAALGQSAQQLGQGDVNFLYNLGAQQQKQQQAVLDAQRASAMQTALQPYQQLAFQSDIYKGAPSSQMAMTSQQTPTPSPFQQVAGLGVGIAGLTGAANKSGLF
jgi:hypothetical protein